MDFAEANRLLQLKMSMQKSEIDNLKRRIVRVTKENKKLADENVILGRRWLQDEKKLAVKDRALKQCGETVQRNIKECNKAKDARKKYEDTIRKELSAEIRKCKNKYKF